MHAEDSALATESLLCPKCGFDLRATQSDRCGECGFVFDRAAMKESGFPWAHRRKIGRVRAYLKTFWAITSGSGSLIAETARPQDARDGRNFARINAIILALTSIGAFVGVLNIDDHGIGLLDVTPNVNQSVRAFFTSSTLDFTLPWSAGATNWVVLPICLLLLSAYFIGAVRTVFDSRLFDPARRQRAVAISYYVTAPMALLCPAALCASLGWAFETQTFPILTRRNEISVAVVLYLLSCFVAAAALFGALFQVASWYKRIRHVGGAHALLAAARVAGLWIFGVVVLLGLLPWTLGFLWLAFDSFRR